MCPAYPTGARPAATSARSSSWPTTPKTCKFARAGRRQPQIGLVARPASPAQQGREPRALLRAESRPLGSVRPVPALRSSQGRTRVRDLQHRRGSASTRSPCRGLAADQPPSGSDTVAASRNAGVSRSIDTTSTPCSTRWTPCARTRHTTGTAPRRHHRRRRRDGHAACSRTRPRWRSSYARVLVSTTKVTPVGAIASESMSPRPRHGRECRSRHPSP